MAIQIKIKRKFIVNHKKYQSLEEMPDDIRQAIEKTMTNSEPNTRRKTETKIVVNGKEYDSIEEMPPDIREQYEKAIKALRTSKMNHDEVLLADEGMSSGNLHKKTISYGGPGPIEPQSSFPRWVITGLVFIAVIMTLYFLIHFKIAPAHLNFLRPSGDYQVYFYRDADGDGRGNPEEWILGKMNEEPPPGYTVVVGDCDDHDANK